MAQRWATHPPLCQGEVLLAVALPWHGTAHCQHTIEGQPFLDQGEVLLAVTSPWHGPTHCQRTMEGQPFLVLGGGVLIAVA